MKITTAEQFDELIKPHINALIAACEEHEVAMSVFGTYNLERRLEIDGFYESCSGGSSSVFARQHSAERLVLQAMLASTESVQEFKEPGLDPEKWAQILQVALHAANTIIEGKTPVTH